jgi:hypothetical protein
VEPPPIDDDGTDWYKDTLYKISQNDRQATFFQRNGLAVNTTYSFRARAVTLNDDGTEVYGESTEIRTAITDNGTPGAFGFTTSAISMVESTEDLVVTVTRSAEGGVTTVDYEILYSGVGTMNDYDMKINEDMLANQRGTLVFEDGVRAQTVTLSLLDDAVFEYPNEKMGIVLSNPTGKATLSNKTVMNITVLDDEDAGIISFSSNEMSVSESFTIASVTLTRTQGTSGRLRVLVVDALASEGNAVRGVPVPCDYDQRQTCYVRDEAAAGVPFRVDCNDSMTTFMIRCRTT